MKIHCQLIIILLWFCHLNATAQAVVDSDSPGIEIKPDQDTPHKYSVVGMNMTYLITMLVPFGNSTGEGGPYSYAYKRYGKKSAFRFNLGLNAGVFTETNETDHWGIALSLGYERKRLLYKNFGFYSGLDLGIIAGDWRLPLSSSGDSEDNVSFGGGPVLGFTYDINKHIYLSMETTIFIGISPDLFDGSLITMRIIPPVGIFLNVRL